MKRNLKDRVQGSAQEIKGKAKQKVGEVTGNRGMESKGRAEKARGKIQRKVGEVEKVTET